MFQEAALCEHSLYVFAAEQSRKSNFMDSSLNPNLDSNCVCLSWVDTRYRVWICSGIVQPFGRQLKVRPIESSCIIIDMYCRFRKCFRSHDSSFTATRYRNDCYTDSQQNLENRVGLNALPSSVRYCLETNHIVPGERSLPPVFVMISERFESLHEVIQYYRTRRHLEGDLLPETVVYSNVSTSKYMIITKFDVRCTHYTIPFISLFRFLTAFASAAPFLHSCSLRAHHQTLQIRHHHV